MSPAPRAGRKEWIGLLVLALPCLLYSMDLTVLNLAVPSLTADLRPTSSELLWIVDVYGFMVAGSLITMGTLGDRIGRRRLLMIGAVAFGVVSVIAAVSTSPEMLIVARALLGVAGATIAPSTLSLIRNMFLDAGQRTVAVGVWITSYSVGGAIGPLVGGVLLEHFAWGSVFLVSVPIMVAILVFGPLLLPEYRDPAAGRLDLWSAALSLVAVLAVIYGLKHIAVDGLDATAVLTVVGGVVAGVVFVRRQRRLADPLIELRLFRMPAFTAALVTYLLATFIAFGSYLFIAQYLQLALGLSPLHAGLWTLPWAGGFILGSNLAPAAARRLRPATVITGGLLMAALGFGFLTQVAAGGLAAIVAGSVVFSVGLAPTFTLGTDMIIGAARPEQAGAAAALSETSSELGGALGIAIMGSIGTAIYRSAIAAGIPAGVSAEAGDAARDTLGGAVAVAERLPAALGAELARAASQAFTTALVVTAAICAVVALGTAVVAGWMLRRVRTA